LEIEDEAIRDRDDATPCHPLETESNPKSKKNPDITSDDAPLTPFTP